MVRNVLRITRVLFQNGTTRLAGKVRERLPLMRKRSKIKRLAE
jgi:hypothetical protein